jgi:hypothetical protein
MSHTSKQIPFGRGSEWAQQYWPDLKDRRFTLSDVATVYAWPSTGGRLELEDANALELDFLGIQDHFTEIERSPNATEEDAFALKLRRIGGTFYQYRAGLKYGDLRQNEVHMWLGWPEDDQHRGGVWVLKLKYSEKRDRMTGRIKLAKTMKERCRAIEMCGGTFYPNPTDEHLVSLDPLPGQ